MRAKWKKTGGVPDRDKLHRDLARRIAIWAETWRRCPRRGCRRNRACLSLGACAGVDRNAELTDEQRRMIRRAIDAEMVRRGLRD